MAALTRLWAAYLNWRIEQHATTHLRSMSDAQLSDIGLVRPQIEFGVRMGRNSEPDRFNSNARKEDASVTQQLITSREVKPISFAQ